MQVSRDRELTLDGMVPKIRSLWRSLPSMLFSGIVHVEAHRKIERESESISQKVRGESGKETIASAQRRQTLDQGVHQLSCIFRPSPRFNVFRQEWSRIFSE